ncbi:MAG: hypothetical protein E6J78_03980 [Deltaproteobacteria bacterium]|nr:MAG: hypothetical protein E6J78_03980 [Deltaproteobacteria bacterium]
MLVALFLVAQAAIPAGGGIVSGTTSGGSNYSGSCAANPTANSPEVVFSWTPSASGTATLYTCSPNTKFDTVLYVRSSLYGSELACNDDTSGCGTGDGSYNADHHGSKITMSVTAGQTYYVFVDGYAWSSGGNLGAFQLTVSPPTPPSLSYTPPAGLQNVFVIWMENADWSSIKGNPSLPYINSLLSSGAHAESYQQLPDGGSCLHPSAPNYLYAETGQDPGFRDNYAPNTSGHLQSGDHLSGYLKRVGISVRNYSQSVPSGICPVDQSGNGGAAVLPLSYFADLTGNGSASDAGCIARHVPLSQFSTDLAAGLTPRYSLITLDDAHSGHDNLAAGDSFLSGFLPPILSSPQVQNNGAVFIVWDEGTSSSGCAPIGLIALSPLAKAGYSNTVPYSHASLLRTMQAIFGVKPYLGAAASANDFSDLFQAGAWK